MQQLLLVLKKFNKIFIGLLLISSMQIASAEIDLKQQKLILDSLSKAVSTYENEDLNVSKYDQGLLENYSINNYSEKYAGGENGYRTFGTYSVNKIPECCEPDLYLHIFGEIHYQTQNQIIEAATQEVGYFFESSFIDNYSSGGSDDIATATKERSKLQEVYDEQTEIIATTNSAILKSKASEIFANDSTLDSNFDLLTDLKEIESLLFGVNTPWETFSIPPINQDQLSNPTNVNTSLQESDLNEVIDDLNDDINPDIQPPNEQEVKNQENDIDLNEAQQDFTPDQCGVSPVVQEKLQELANPSISNNDSTIISSPDNNNSSLPINNSDSEDLEPNNQSSQALNNPNQLPSFNASNPLYPSFQCYTGSDVVYSSIGDPSQRLCFYVKEIRQDLRFLTPTNSCTNCIFSQMYDELLDTNDKNLIPNKLTGNYFEPPICKKDLLNKINSINVNFIAKPIFNLSSPYKAISQIDPSKISQKFRAAKVKTPPIDFSNTGNFIEVVQDIQEYQRQALRSQIDTDLNLRLEESSSTQNSVNTQLKERMGLFNKNLKSLQDSIFSINETAKLFRSKPKCQ